MVQYVSGGKWGLLLRRPLEAMSRCLPLILVLFLPIGVFMKKLYLWAKYSDTVTALRHHLITHEQAHAIAYKRPMLSVTSVWIQSAIIFAIWFFFMFFLNKWGLAARCGLPAEHPLLAGQARKPQRHRHPHLLAFNDRGAIDWVMSLDPTWYSSIWGLLFLVGQGYAVLALGIITVFGSPQPSP